MRYKLAVIIAWLIVLALSSGSVEAAARRDIIFIPHDNRPVSLAQTAETLWLAGYKVTVPPEELLGSRYFWGDPDGLWSWLNEQLADKRAASLVVSTDAMLYGSLVGSRKHDFTIEQLVRRAEQFADLKRLKPQLRIYGFGSIMRTPRQAGSEEPAYYAQYGPAIFQITALRDKADIQGLSRRERRQLKNLQESVPEEALADWLARRDKNFVVNKRLIDLTRSGVFDYLALGRDDNAPFSQTHKESRLLSAYGGDLSKVEFQTLAGIDEMGMALAARAINDQRVEIPLVAVRYADGVGAATVPTYSDEAIGLSVKNHLTAAGALQVASARRADYALLVYTKPDGTTAEANSPDNTAAYDAHKAAFADMVQEYVASNIPVAVADISHGNGADNGLMAELARRGLLPKLLAYSGWNTANNSAGFAIGQGIAAKGMPETGRRHLLAVRLLDDWAYQANARQAVAARVGEMPGGGYSELNELYDFAVADTKRLLTEFAAANLADFSIDSVQVAFPWNRMFEISARPVELVD